MRKTLILIAGAALLAGCGSGGGSSSSQGTQTATGADGGTPSPSQFAERIDNPWLPFLPGMKWVYRGIKDGEPSRDVVTVPSETRVIQGVKCTVVKDMLYLNGKLEERTTDWYAQDKSGNVWYFGEATAELKPNGAVKSTEGSWLSGRDGAEAGLFMPADPHVGQTARQEYYHGQAEDHFQVVSLNASVTTPAITSHEALLTKEWTPLEPAVLDHKYYVRGMGTVKEIAVKGPLEKNILLEFHKG